MARNRTQAPASDAPERFRNVFNQKPRTSDEENAAWVRRIKRWKRKALAGGTVLEEVNAHIEAVLAGVGSHTKDDKGLKLWAFKAHKVLGEEAVIALLKSAVGYKSADL
jgi:hypothetical protein